MTGRGAFVAATLLLSACDVASVNPEPSAIAKNQCESSAECGGADCEQGHCRSHSGTLSTVLFQVTPADASAIAGVQFLRTLSDLSPAGGDLPLVLDVVSQVNGQVTVGDRKCMPKFDDQGTQLVTAANASIPATLTLTPSSSVLGVYSPRAVVQSALVGEKYFGFSLNVPPGPYDIYVEPKHQPDDSCPIPPRLLRNQKFSGGQLSLEIKLPEPATFDFHVTWPHADGALDGWLVDMLDPASGHVISNRATLAAGVANKSDYSAKLYYLPVLGGTPAESGGELVRLSPPSNSATPAPTILMARSALGLFSPTQGVLSQFTSLPNAVHVQGTVTAMVTPVPVAAAVTLVATKIIGVDPGVLASFVRTVAVGTDGKLDVDLLPGTYRVSAVPRSELNAASTSSSESNLSAVTQQWEVPTTPSYQAGKVIDLGVALVVTGQAVSGATPLATAEVAAVTSPASVQSDFLQQALGETLPLPRASSGTVGGDGTFRFTVDAGTFDISVRPMPSTGFGWLVIPGVAIGTLEQGNAGLSLHEQQAPLPVAYRGTVALPGGALIRAYVYMSGGVYTSDPSKADSVLQVAETRAEASGSYEVLIPAELNHPVP